MTKSGENPTDFCPWGAETAQRCNGRTQLDIKNLCREGSSRFVQKSPASFFKKESCRSVLSPCPAGPSLAASCAFVCARLLVTASCAYLHPTSKILYAALPRSSGVTAFRRRFFK